MRAPSLVVLLAGPSLQGGPGHWDYRSKAEWAGECGTGQAQSPVDIRWSAADQTRLPGWQLVGYSSERKGEVLNNGHTFQFGLGGSPIQVSGGGLSDTYTFAQGQFHWGNQSDRGSEHLLYGRAFPLELHLVHYNSKYRGIDEAVESAAPDALLVIGVLFSLSPKDSPYLAPLLASLPEVIQADGRKAVPISSPVQLGSLLPTDPSAFYRYNGSLTTPTCNEVVSWTVLHHTAGVSEGQLETLRSLQDGDGHTLGNNFRAVQPLHGRKLAVHWTGGNWRIEEKSRLYRQARLSRHQAQAEPEPEGLAEEPEPEPEGLTTEVRPQWYYSMVPGWAVVLICLAVALNVGAVAALLARRGRKGAAPNPSPSPPNFLPLPQEENPEMQEMQEL